MTESSPPKRALVVDDDPSARGFFSRLLTLEGYEVATASNGLEAKNLVRAAEFELVLSDINMPGMGGVQLLHAVREFDLDVPVILITGAPSLETATKAVEYGAMRYLVKPVKPADLREVVHSAQALYKLAKLKRQALELQGLARSPTDLAGLHGSFRRALGSLCMVYQPITRYSTRTTWAYEALARTGETSLRGPADMISAADRLGLLHQLGRATREHIARAIPSISAERHMLINLDPRELDDEELYSEDAPLFKYAHRIVIELTERARLEDIARLTERVSALRKIGYRFAIDDLGAGYASLQTFVHLQPDIAKIDMSLVRDIDAQPTKQRIVRSIQSLCADMGIEMIAEGIETRAERDCIADLGIDLMQGYLFSRPDLNFVNPRDSSFGIPSDPEFS